MEEIFSRCAWLKLRMPCIYGVYGRVKTCVMCGCVWVRADLAVCMRARLCAYVQNVLAYAFVMCNVCKTCHSLPPWPCQVFTQVKNKGAKGWLLYDTGDRAGASQQLSTAGDTESDTCCSVYAHDVLFCCALPGVCPSEEQGSQGLATL